MRKYSLKKELAKFKHRISVLQLQTGLDVTKQVSYKIKIYAF